MRDMRRAFDGVDYQHDIAHALATIGALPALPGLLQFAHLSIQNMRYAMRGSRWARSPLPAIVNPNDFTVSSSLGPATASLYTPMMRRPCGTTTLSSRC